MPTGPLIGKILRVGKSAGFGSIHRHCPRCRSHIHVQGSITKACRLPSPCRPGFCQCFGEAPRVQGREQPPAKARGSSVCLSTTFWLAPPTPVPRSSLLGLRGQDLYPASLLTVQAGFALLFFWQSQEVRDVADQDRLRQGRRGADGLPQARPVLQRISVNRKNLLLVFDKWLCERGISLEQLLPQGPPDIDAVTTWLSI